jgi:hypothetical protein
MTRVPEWEIRLQSFLLRANGQRFGYGRLDCCLFVCDAILAMTGIDVAKAFRNRYSSRREALHAIKEETGSASILAIASAVTSAFGMPAIAPSRASRGDVVLLRRSHDHSLGLVDLNGRDILVPVRQGIWRLPMSQAVRAWRV